MDSKDCPERDALKPNGWVENRFRLVEERLARLEGDEPDDLDEVRGSLTDAGMTVGRMRALLAHHDPRTPLFIEVDGDERQDCRIWCGQTLDEQATSPLRATYNKRVILRCET